MNEKFEPAEEATLKQTAAFFKISINTLGRWRKKPGFPKPTSMVDGSRMMFLVSDLVAYRDRRLRTPVQPARRRKKAKTKEPAEAAGPDPITKRELELRALLREAERQALIRKAEARSGEVTVDDMDPADAGAMACGGRAERDYDFVGGSFPIRQRA